MITSDGELLPPLILLLGLTLERSASNVVPGGGSAALGQDSGWLEQPVSGNSTLHQAIQA